MTVATVPLRLDVFEAAFGHVAPHTYRTPLVSSRMLSERTGHTVRLKAEMFQRTGSYRIRGPLNKFMSLSDDERWRGIVCSSAGNHAQGVALAARIDGIHGRGDGRERDAVIDRSDARVRRRGRAARHDLGRSEREGQGTSAGRLERRVRFERRERQPRPAPRVAVELIPDRCSRASFLPPSPPRTQRTNC
jgi:hypothetical protein